MGEQDNTAWSSSTWTPRTASLLFKGPVSAGSFQRVRVGPPGEGRVRHRQGNSAVLLRPIPCLTSPSHSKPSIPSLSLNSLSTRVRYGRRLKMCHSKGHTSLWCRDSSGQKAKRPQPRPRRRSLNQEQQRGGRKLRVTRAARWARGGVAALV